MGRVQKQQIKGKWCAFCRMKNHNTVECTKKRDIKKESNHNSQPQHNSNNNNNSQRSNKNNKNRISQNNQNQPNNKRGNQNGRSDNDFLCSYCREPNHYASACQRKQADLRKQLSHIDEDTVMASPILTNFVQVSAAGLGVPAAYSIDPNFASAITVAAAVKAKFDRDCNVQQILEDAHKLKAMTGLPMVRCFEKLTDNGGSFAQVLETCDRQIREDAGTALEILKGFELPGKISKSWTPDRMADLIVELCRSNHWDKDAVTRQMVGILAAIAFEVNLDDEERLGALRGMRRSQEGVIDLVARVRTNIKEIVEEYDADYDWALGVLKRMNFDTHSAKNGAPEFLVEEFRERFGLSYSDTVGVLKSTKYKRKPAIDAYKARLLEYIYPLTEFAAQDPSELGDNAANHRWTMNRKRMAHELATKAEWNKRTLDETLSQAFHERTGIRKDAIYKEAAVQGGFAELWKRLWQEDFSPSLEYYIS